jgi:hypothetical protein
MSYGPALPLLAPTDQYETAYLLAPQILEKNAYGSTGA